ncbi:P-loop containing nucleoside triphosphate hydrolase protein [Coprinopsis sp. MPI-PUGE-AT-0042]|nr:P-loop containing nucleoside triphosphate hydrolase protein [Coprinopsis sp. MPI-PUGE-AT-0042]
MASNQNSTSQVWMRRLGFKDGDLNPIDGREDDIVILVMGPTGVGKSTFIKEYTGNQDVEVGHQLQSCTRDVSWYQATVPRRFPRLAGRRLILVDTPGFDDTYADDSEILKRVSAWLAQSYNKQMHIAGVIYMNDISQKRMFGSTRMNLNMFTKLCGVAFFTKVVLATSQWDLLPEPATGDNREEELKRDFWKNIQGAKIMRVQKNPDIANDTSPHKAIVNHLLDAHSRHLDERNEILEIQKEIVDLKKILPATKAGKELKYTIEELIKLQKAALANNGVDEQGKQEMEKKQRLLKEQLKAVKSSLSDKIKSFFGLG